VLTPPRLRYLKVTLVCGALAALIAAGFLELGVFRALDAKLSAFLGHGSPAPMQRAPQYWAILFCAFGIAWTTIDVPRYLLKVLIAGVVVCEIVTAVWVFNIYGHFFSPFACLTATIVALVGGLIYSRTDAGSRKRVLRQLFGERVSNHMFNALLDSHAPARFDGELREATVLVCEIFNHEALLESLGARNYVAMTNAFLRKAADFLVERGGYLDECDGERLRVVFGVPLPDAQHASRACDAALDLQARLDEVSRECEARWGGHLDFRIGINSGEIVFAAYGSDRLGGVSISGEPVEFARRLCAANTIYGSGILLGNGTFSLAEATVEVRPMELIQRSRENPTREEVYELLAARGELTMEEATRRDLFWKGIVFYREQKWDEALTQFKLARELFPDDGPSEFYIRRVEQLRSGVGSLEWSHP
jgi:class 3 adenylate cyclase